jgi:hypothetical protein
MEVEEAQLGLTRTHGTDAAAPKPEPKIRGLIAIDTLHRQLQNAALHFDAKSVPTPWEYTPAFTQLIGMLRSMRDDSWMGLVKAAPAMTAPAPAPAPSVDDWGTLPAVASTALVARPATAAAADAGARPMVVPTAGFQFIQECRFISAEDPRLQPLLTALFNTADPGAVSGFARQVADIVGAQPGGNPYGVLLAAAVHHVGGANVYAFTRVALRGMPLDDPRLLAAVRKLQGVPLAWVLRFALMTMILAEDGGVPGTHYSRTQRASTLWPSATYTTALGNYNIMLGELLVALGASARFLTYAEQEALAGDMRHPNAPAWTDAPTAGLWRQVEEVMTRFTILAANNPGRAFICGAAQAGNDAELARSIQQLCRCCRLRDPSRGAEGVLNGLYYIEQKQAPAAAGRTGAQLLAIALAEKWITFTDEERLLIPREYAGSNPSSDFSSSVRMLVAAVSDCAYGDGRRRRPRVHADDGGILQQKAREWATTMGPTSDFSAVMQALQEGLLSNETIRRQASLPAVVVAALATRGDVNTAVVLYSLMLNGVFTFTPETLGVQALVSPDQPLTATARRAMLFAAIKIWLREAARGAEVARTGDWLQRATQHLCDAVYVDIMVNGQLGAPTDGVAQTALAGALYPGEPFPHPDRSPKSNMAPLFLTLASSPADQDAALCIIAMGPLMASALDLPLMFVRTVAWSITAGFEEVARSLVANSEFLLGHLMPGDIWAGGAAGYAPPMSPASLDIIFKLLLAVRDIQGHTNLKDSLKRALRISRWHFTYMDAAPAGVSWR